MLLGFADTYDIDAAEVHTRQENVSENDNGPLFTQTNFARDFYGLGRYREKRASSTGSATGERRLLR